MKSLSLLCAFILSAGCSNSADPLSPDDAGTDIAGQIGCVAQLVAGEKYTCARKSDGTLWCWGMNSEGQLGDGTTAGRGTPVQVAALGAGVVQVSAGGSHTCARKRDGSLWCWGWNATGALGDGTRIGRKIPIQVTALGNEVAQVSAGTAETCARKTDGTLWCWGGSRLSDRGPLKSTTPVQITSLGTSVTDVAVGTEDVCARKIDNSLWCWGHSVKGQLANGKAADQDNPVQVTSFGTTVAEVSLGYYNACVRKTDGSLWCWGDLAHSGDGSTTGSRIPVQVSTLGTSVTQVSVKFVHSCARKIDGSTWCWGVNVDGQIGDATTMTRTIPVQVAALGSRVDEIATGFAHTCARTAEGAVWCWGANDFDQLGIGRKSTQELTPVQTLLTCSQ